MIDADKQEFWKKLKAVMAVSANGKEVTPEVFEIWWNVLGEYSMDQVTAALSVHVKTNKFAPAPADIIGLIPDNLNYLPPEEAWNRVPKSEWEGAFVCDEMMQAAAAASSSLENGNHVAARMAFLESYKSLVANAKLHKKPAKYWFSAPSLGSQEVREQVKELALIEARDRNLIPVEYANQQLQLSQNKPTVSLEFYGKNIKSLPGIDKKAKQVGRSQIAEIRKKLNDVDEGEESNA